jgi:hypothetical protein
MAGHVGSEALDRTGLRDLILRGPQFTQIDKYNSLISKKEIPALSRPRLAKDAIKGRDSGG